MKKLKYVVAMAVMALGCMGVAPGCGSLAYQADGEFKNSGEANSNEDLVFVQTRACKNMHGKVGTCATDVLSNTSLPFHLDPREYSYRVKVFCSEGVIDPGNPSKPWSHIADVPKGEAHDFELPAAATKTLKAYKCKGRIFPDDRLNKMASGFAVSVEVVDKEYEARERMYWRDGYLVLGKHALYSQVCAAGKCKRYKKKTVVKAPEDAVAYSESEVMRFNYRGY